MKFLTLLSALCLIAIAKGEDTETAIDGHNGKIVGGVATSINSVPYQVALITPMNRIFCGGSIISANFILTAAHCVPGASPNQMRVRAGSSWFNTGGQVAQVLTINSHPNYNQGSAFNNDIAILRISSLTLGDNVRAVRLPTSGQYVSVGSMATASGWGHQYSGGSSDTQLRAVLLRIEAYNTCNRVYNYALTNSMLCAYTANRDTCQNDSGGPLVFNGLQYGITSFGRGCATRNFPGVYCSVADPAMRAWIQRITGI